MARILVVDDDAEVLNVVADIVEALGHEAFRADTGLTALVIVDAVRPDLMILDLAMPEPSGGAVLDQVRRQDPNLPVIVLTGALSPDVEVDMRRRGATSYLIKPVEMRELGRHIDTVLRSRSPHGHEPPA